MKNKQTNKFLNQNNQTQQMQHAHETNKSNKQMQLITYNNQAKNKQSRSRGTIGK